MENIRLRNIEDEYSLNIAWQMKIKDINLGFLWEEKHVLVLDRPNPFWGKWKEEEGQSINLRDFWKAVKEDKLPYEKAAFKTFTGAWAKKNGFTKVVFDPNTPATKRIVIVKFLKQE